MPLDEKMKVMREEFGEDKMGQNVFDQQGEILPYSQLFEELFKMTTVELDFRY